MLMEKITNLENLPELLTEMIRPLTRQTANVLEQQQQQQPPISLPHNHYVSTFAV